MNKASKELPESLEDCFEFMDVIRSNFSAVDKEWFDHALNENESYFRLEMHHSLGRHIRNNWGMWAKDSPIYLWFKEKGITHADDMSGIVLTSYHRLQHAEPINLEGQIRVCKHFWAEENE